MGAGEVKGAVRQIMADNPVPIITNDILSEEPSVAEATRLSAAVLEQLNQAIAARDTEAVKSLLLPQQTLWKDSVALTYHLRTFYTAETIAKHIVKTADLRQLGEFRPVGEAIVNPLLVLEPTMISCHGLAITDAVSEMYRLPHCLHNRLSGC